MKAVAVSVSKYRRGGWYGNPQGHAMAARGICTYASKNRLMMEPVFYAQKREEQVPFASIVDDVRTGSTFGEISRKHPDADREDLRKRGIKATEVVEGGNSLSMLDRNGVDQTVSLARSNPHIRHRMIETLNNKQKVSFLPEVKADLLKQRLGELL